MRSFGDSEEGQALVIVGIAMVVLLGALALSIDWGYGFAVRRAAQNQADAAALAAARLLAVSYIGAAGAGTPFNTTAEAAWCEAARARDANGGPAVGSSVLTVAFSHDGSSWTAINDADCLAIGTTAVAADTLLVRVTTSATYATLLAAVTKQPIAVAASARARITAANAGPATGVRQLVLPATTVPGVGLSGATTMPNVAIWPIALHFDIEMFTGSTPCGEGCDPAAPGVSPITLWPSSTSAGDRYGTFGGLLTFAHYSTRGARGDDVPCSTCVHQLVTESDYTATVAGAGQHGHDPTPRIAPNQSDRASCPGPTWDTNGSSAISNAVACDIPNWFYYGYRGSVSLGTDWTDPSWTGFESAPGAVELPAPLAVRKSCTDVGAHPNFQFTAASCANPSAGDWVETATGELTVNMALRMKDFIARYGREVPYSSTVVGRQTLGKAVVVHVLFWDCAEHYDTSQPVGSQWSRIDQRRTRDDDPNDCSQIVRGDIRHTTVDRVHLFTVVPFTFYEGLITTGGSTATVKAYWGDSLADAGSCATIPLPAGCDPNPLVNSAFLVPDE